MPKFIVKNYQTYKKVLYFSVKIQYNVDNLKNCFGGAFYES